MFKVIILDDEPIALQLICNIVNTKYPEFEIVATAENGVDGYELIKSYRPDLVISDVKMPLMTGIELLKIVKDEFPDILSVIVSGYQDFDYARSAIQSGVTDYILKPVVPSQIAKTMDKILSELKTKHYKMRNNIVRQICRGSSYDKDAISHYFTYQKYYGAIIRSNGLPKRFNKGNEIEIYSDINEIMTVYGRDEMEELFLIPTDLLSGVRYQDYLNKVFMNLKNKNPYVTLIYYKHCFPVEKMHSEVKKLYQLLDSRVVIGLNQMKSAEEIKSDEKTSNEEGEITSVINKIEYFMSHNQHENLKKELKKIYHSWANAEKSQLWIETVSRQILYTIRRNEGNLMPLTECEYMMEDAFFYSTTMDELIENLMEIFFRNVKDTFDYMKIDTPDFLKSIKKYIELHMSESLSLQSICTHFNISQTYMSKLFRKYENKSFNQYLTSLRIENAIKLMQSDSNLYVKDVAAMVGYSDQFYFSRIFRSYTSKCPSDYFCNE